MNFGPMQEARGLSGIWFRVGSGVSKADVIGSARSIPLSFEGSSQINGFTDGNYFIDFDRSAFGPRAHKTRSVSIEKVHPQSMSNHHPREHSVLSVMQRSISALDSDESMQWWNGLLS